MGMFRGAIAITCIILTMLIWTVGNHAIGILNSQVPSMLQTQILNQTVNTTAIENQVNIYYTVFKFSLLFVTLVAIAWAIKEPKTEINEEYM